MSRKSILVVDDEKSQREILEMILSGEGYDVTTASSGEAAMKFVADRHDFHRRGRNESDARTRSFNRRFARNFRRRNLPRLSG